MASIKIDRFLILLTVAMICTESFAQYHVPLGINYQAVARDNYGNELANRKISVKFSIISGEPLGTVVYEEVHQNVITSAFGVFSLIIGQGIPTGNTPFGELSQVEWEKAFHYLKVEVKFENSFMDMGTMPFLAVPYALYARRSLEPGPQGPSGEAGPQGIQGAQGLKGEPGNPATDDQTLSFNGNNLSISGGNTVNLSTLNVPHQLSILGDTLSIMGGNKVGLLNQIQDLQLDVNNKLKISKNAAATEIDLTKFLDDRQQLNFNSVDNTLTITGGNSVNLSPIKQDLLLTGNTLTITNKVAPAQVDLSRYLQSLVFTPDDNKLQIEGGNKIDLTPLKNDADADPLNEMQNLSWDPVNRLLGISGQPGAINLTELKNDPDADPLNEIQNLSWDPVNRLLGISGQLGTINLAELKNDNDADPVNEIQDLSLVANKLTITKKTNPAEINLTPYLDNTDNQILAYNSSTYSLSLTNGGSVSLGGLIAFRSKKISSETVPSWMTDYDFVAGTIDYNDGGAYDNLTGLFNAPVAGIYVFNISYTATGIADSRILKIFLNGSLYEILNSGITPGSSLTRQITMKLVAGDKVKAIINVGTGFETGTGSFSGFRVY